MRKRTQLKWTRRVVPLLLVAIAFGAGAWALTASNTFAGSSGGAAGGGSATISGYAVSAPSYTLLGGKITCDSEPSGVTCTDTSTGHFFRVSGESYQLG